MRISLLVSKFNDSLYKYNNHSEVSTTYATAQYIESITPRPKGNGYIVGEKEKYIKYICPIKGNDNINPRYIFTTTPQLKDYICLHYLFPTIFLFHRELNSLLFTPYIS